MFKKSYIWVKIFIVVCVFVGVKIFLWKKKKFIFDYVVRKWN